MSDADFDKVMSEPIAPPEEVRLIKAQSRLELKWPDGHRTSLSFSLLRRYCACSECRAGGHIGNTEPPEDIGIFEVQPAGVSGLQFFFSDGHARGIYPWRYLRDLPGLDKAKELQGE